MGIASAKEVEVHFLLFFFLFNFLLFLLRRTAATTATAKLQEFGDVLAATDFGEESWEEGLDLAPGSLDELVKVLLCNVETRVGENHAGVRTEKFILLGLGHLGSSNLSHSSW